MGNILVFRIGQLGDTLVAMPAIHIIRERHPNHRLVLLTDRQPSAGYVSAWHVLEPTRWFDAALFYPPVRDVWHAPVALVELAKKIRELRCEVVYDVSPERTRWQSIRDRIFFQWIAGIRDYRGGGYLRKPGKSTDGSLPRVEPEWRRLVDAVCSESPTKAEFHFSIPRSEERTALEHISKRGIAEGMSLLAISPGSKTPAKVWPNEYYRAVGQRLLGSYPGLHLVIVGGRDDSALAQGLCNAWGERAHNFAGLLSPYGSAALLQRCLAYLGNDTGAMHLAGMVGTPCVALFSAHNHPGRWEPYGEGHVILRHETDCAGCMLDVCPHENMCMKLITVDEVFQSVDALLKRSLAFE